MLFSFLLSLVLVNADPSSMMGGGNFDNGIVTPTYIAQIQALNVVGAKMCRVNIYPGNYYNEQTGKVVTEFDDLFLRLNSAGITPMILFEYYWSMGFPVGNYNKWHSIGSTFAARYGPGGILAKQHGLGNYGVSIFSAFNEPEGTGLPKGDYHAALEGLSDGVHSVNADFKVNPGGFKNANAFSDWKLDGFGPALADLWNNGKLNGIDLHTYYDVQYAPINNTYMHSAQNNFDQVKKNGGITRDINFYTTEFNFKKRIVDEQEAAVGFLTGIWDNLGVVNNEGKSCTQFAFVWNIFFLTSSDTDYGLAIQLNPWQGTLRGQTLQMVLKLTVGMNIISADPKGTGEYILAGAGKQMWVWQNRNAWTNHAGTSYTVTNIPSNTQTLEVYNWQGRTQSISIAGKRQITVQGLATDQTWMFLAR